MKKVLTKRTVHLIIVMCYSKNTQTVIITQENYMKASQLIKNVNSFNNDSNADSIVSLLTRSGFGSL